MLYTLASYIVLSALECHKLVLVTEEWLETVESMDTDLICTNV